MDGGVGYSVRQTSDGGYIVAGGFIQESSFPTCYDAYLMKTDSLGDTLWTWTYEGTGHDIGRCVRQTKEGDYIVVGSLNGISEAEPAALWLFKVDAYGELIWGRAYGNDWEDEGRWVEETSDGKYIISGSWNPTGGINRRCWLLKADETGDTLWTKTYLFTSHGYCVRQTTDEGYIIASPIGLIKTDSLGDTIWVNSVSSGCVRQTTDGGYIQATSHNQDIWIIKTDSVGDSVWTSTYGGDDEDYSYDVQQTTDSGFIILGETRSFGAGNYDVWLLKTDANGDTLWTRTIGGYHGDHGYSVHQTHDGGYIITGITSSFGIGCGHLWLIKTDSLGYVGVEEHPVTHQSDWEVISSIGRHITLSYSDRPEGFRASIYDATGRRIDEIHSTAQSGTVTWPVTPGEGMSPGVYFVREESEHHSTTRKVILIR